jgi:hypothetical protein
MRRFFASLTSAALVALFLRSVATAQCSAPELVKGADKYNELVCKAAVAAQSGKDRMTLELLLSASKQPVLESPNIRLFGQIAETYARLGRFRESDLFLKYDDLSLLWMIGIIRCRETPGSKDESLVQDGKPLTSEEAKYMAGVLCGPVFDEFSYFRDRDAKSFIPAAEAILRYRSVRNEIDSLKEKLSLPGDTNGAITPKAR